MSGGRRAEVSYVNGIVLSGAQSGSSAWRDRVVHEKLRDAALVGIYGDAVESHGVVTRCGARRTARGQLLDAQGFHVLAPGGYMREGGCREPRDRYPARSTPAWSIDAPHAACVHAYYPDDWLTLRVGSRSAGGRREAARRANAALNPPSPPRRNARRAGRGSAHRGSTPLPHAPAR